MNHFTKNFIKNISITGFALLGFLNMSLYGQTFEWVSGYQGTEDAFGQNVAADDAGNVYSVGYFYDTVDFDPGAGTFDLISPGQQDIYITKLDVDGNLVWAHRFGNADRNRGDNVAVDSEGNVYISGYFEGTVDFDPGPVNRFFTSVNVIDAFVLKLDSNGNFMWFRQFGSSVISEALDVKIDNNDNVLVAGYFQGDCDFDMAGDGYSLSSVDAGNRDAFLTKLTSTGDFVWTRHQGGTTDGRTEAISIDASNNIYGTGFYEGTWDYDLINNPGNQLENSNGGRDIYVYKLDENGVFQWSAGAGDAGDDRGNGVSVNANGNLFITGQFENTVDFDPSGATTTATSAGGLDSYIWSLDENGAFNWVNNIGGTTSDIGYDMSTGPQGNAYLTGYFTGTAAFDGTTNLISSGGNDIYVANYDELGALVWVQQMGDLDNDFGFGIHVSDNWDVHSTGYFRSDCDFDPTGTNTSLTSLGLNDAYVHKLSQSNCTAPTLDSINYVAEDTLFCPGEMTSTELVAIGQLNDAANWEWYTDGCGMTHVASGDTVVFMPTETTTYYVRAEGACGAPQSCDSITIYVDDFEIPVADMATLDDITAICEVNNLNAPTATDNCDGTISGTHDAVLPITSNTTITWTYTDNAGNEEIQTQDVVITGVDVSVTVDGIQLIANNSNVGVSYRWIDCNNGNAPIINATNQTYTPEENGSYAVIVLDDGCEDTSACIDVTTVGLESLSQTDINAYPNPSNGEFVIELPSTKIVAYKITDYSGRLVKEGRFEQQTNTVDLTSEENGIYFLSVDGVVLKLVVSD